MAMSYAQDCLSPASISSQIAVSSQKRNSKVPTLWKENAVWELFNISETSPWAQYR